jgi:hypothetical protein
MLFLTGQGRALSMRGWLLGKLPKLSKCLERFTTGLLYDVKVWWAKWHPFLVVERTKHFVDLNIVSTAHENQNIAQATGRSLDCLCLRLSAFVRTLSHDCGAPGPGRGEFSRDTDLKLQCGQYKSLKKTDSRVT